MSSITITLILRAASVQSKIDAAGDQHGEVVEQAVMTRREQ